MKIFVYVEAESDVSALKALLGTYLRKLREQGHGLSFIPLHDKAKLLRKIGPRAAEALVANDRDCVIALPDLHPTFEGAPAHAHSNLEELLERLTQLVRRALQDGPYRVSSRDLRSHMSRFHPCALKFELEMLLLAVWRQLGEHIGTVLNPRSWRHPVEEQNHTDAGRPKRFVERLFRTRTRKGRAYRDTVDAPGVLRRVADLRTEVLYSVGAQLECPVFKGMLDWLAARTDVPVY